jgi:diguanylate cyclase (GGDEF)-like protein/PAS domain S-box-containing protein
VSNENKTAVSWSNLPISVQPRFDCDQLALIYGTCLLDAVFVVDCESGCLVAANQQLLELLDMRVDELEEREVCFGQLVHPDDRAVFQTWLQEGPVETARVFQVRLIRSDEDVRPVEISLKRIRWQRREYQLGFVRESGDRYRRETRLRQNAEKQKQRAVEALKSSLRMYELNEKIKSTLVLTTKLLNAEDEESLFSEAARVLTNEDGVNFREATILVLQDGVLYTANSTLGGEKKVYSLSENNKYSRLIAEGLLCNTQTDVSQQELVFPLQSRGSLLGIVEVLQHPREKALFDEHRPIREWQKDMLVQIGDIIALLLDNLRLNRELKRQSIVDSLTGAGNRNFFMQKLCSEVQRARRYGRPMSLIFLDVDHFKEINDSYGHVQGDHVLRELGQLFQRNLRKVDVLARYGGDEFVLLLPETSIEMARETAEKLNRSVQDHHFPNLDDPEQPVSVSISVGLAALQSSQDEERFLQAADAALYVAKKEGRNRVAIVEPPPSEPESCTTE